MNTVYTVHNSIIPCCSKPTLVYDLFLYNLFNYVFYRNQPENLCAVEERLAIVHGLRKVRRVVRDYRAMTSPDLCHRCEVAAMGVGVGGAMIDE